MLYKKMKAFMEKYVYPAEQVSDTRCATIQGKVKSAYEPSGPSGRSLSRFL